MLERILTPLVHDKFNKVVESPHSSLSNSQCYSDEKQNILNYRIPIVFWEVCCFSIQYVQHMKNRHDAHKSVA